MQRASVKLAQGEEDHRNPHAEGEQIVAEARPGPAWISLVGKARSVFASTDPAPARGGDVLSGGCGAPLYATSNPACSC